MENFNTKEHILGWRDLSQDEVYDIAVLENQMRDNAVSYLEQKATEQVAKVVFTKDESMLEPVIKEFGKALDKIEAFTETWIEAQALMRGLEYKPPKPREKRKEELILVVSPLVNAHPVQAWILNQIMNLPDGTHQRDIAKAAGISPGYLSGLRKGRKINPSADVINRIATAFADAHELNDESRQLFLQAIPQT